MKLKFLYIYDGPVSLGFSDGYNFIFYDAYQFKHHNNNKHS